jgi:hypothetical protein
MTNAETVALFRKSFDDTAIFYDLDDYLKEKSIYLSNRTKEQMIQLKMAYDLVYTDMKRLHSCGQISYDTFWQLVDILQEGL